jgi:hypothetical protein
VSTSSKLAVKHSDLVGLGGYQALVLNVLSAVRSMMMVTPTAGIMNHKTINVRLSFDYAVSGTPLTIKKSCSCT